MAHVYLSDEMWDELIDATNSINENISYLQEEAAIGEDLKECGFSLFKKDNFITGKNSLTAFERKKYDIFATAFLAPLKPILFNTFEKRGWWKRTKDAIKGGFYFLFVPKNDWVKIAMSTFLKIALGITVLGATVKILKPVLEKVEEKSKDIFKNIKEPIEKVIFSVLNYIKEPIQKELNFIGNLLIFSWESLMKAFWKTDSKDKSIEKVESFWGKIKDIFTPFGDAFSKPYLPPVKPPQERVEMSFREEQEQILDDQFRIIHPIEMMTSIRTNHININDDEAVEKHFKELIGAPKRKKTETQEEYEKRLKIFMEKLKSQNNPFDKNSPLNYFALVNGEWVKRKLFSKEGKFGEYDENGSLITNGEEAENERALRHKNVMDLGNSMQTTEESETGISEMTERTIDLTLINNIKNKLNIIKSPAFFYNVFSALHLAFASVTNFLVDVYYITRTGMKRTDYVLVRRYKTYTKETTTATSKSKANAFISNLKNIDKSKNFYATTSPKRLEAQKKLMEIENLYLKSFHEIKITAEQISNETKTSKVEKPKSKIRNNLTMLPYSSKSQPKGNSVIYKDSRRQLSALT